MDMYICQKIVQIFHGLLFISLVMIIPLLDRLTIGSNEYYNLWYFNS